MSSERTFKATLAQSEYVTRRQLIDRKLKDAGWRVVEFDASKPLSKFDRCAIEEYPTENGPADYALCVGGQILGIVEGKKLAVGTRSTNPWGFSPAAQYLLAPQCPPVKKWTPLWTPSGGEFNKILKTGKLWQPDL